MGGHGVHPVLAEEIVEEVEIIALGEHLRGEQQHGSAADRDEGAVFDERLEDAEGLAFSALGDGRGVDALLVELKGEQQHDEAEEGEHDDADYDGRILHILDDLSVIADDGDAVHHPVRVAEGSDEDDGETAYARTHRTEHRTFGTLALVCGDDGREGAVGDLQRGVAHPEHDICHGGIDHHPGAALLDARPLDEHEYGRECERYGRVEEPRAVSAPLADLDGIGDPAHHGIVDGVPDPCADHHEHDEQRPQSEDVGVELLQQRSHQAEHQTASGVAHGVADVIGQLEPRGTGDETFIRLSRGRLRRSGNRGIFPFDITHDLPPPPRHARRV